MFPVSCGLAVDVAPVYPEPAAGAPAVVTPATVEELQVLTDITVPGDQDEVSHFVEIASDKQKKKEKKSPLSSRTPGRSSTDFEEIIKRRLQKEKEKKERKLALVELAAKPRTVGGPQHQAQDPGSRAARFSSGFRDRSRSRYSAKSRESLYSKGGSSAADTASSASPSSSRFKPSRSSYSVRNRFSSLISDRRESKPTIVKPEFPKSRYKSSSSSSSSSSSYSTSSSSSSTDPANVPEIKKFDRFKRPNYKSNFLNKYIKPNYKPGISIASSQSDETKVPSIVFAEDSPHNYEEVHLGSLMTTLDMSTAYPAELPSSYLEVATIRSPYTFNIEDNEKSTRFITITTSVTKALDIAPSSTFTQPPVAETSSRPLFDTDAIPAPENILASTQLPVLQSSAESEDVSVLAPLTLTSALHQATPPLETVTESMSTVETLTKKSLLPVIFQDSSSVLTLTQTYSVTRIVTAVKTVPPMELYEFNPQANFADFDLLFEEAGSERRESLLPGELEFSDQDNFGLEGPSIVKVKPPQHFHEDIDLLGSKFFETDRHSNPVPAPNIESSFGSPNTRLGAGLATTPTQTQATPSLPDNGLAALGITPEQLLYLQLLQNPLAALGIGGAFQQPQVQTEYKSGILYFQNVYNNEC